MTLHNMTIFLNLIVNLQAEQTAIQCSMVLPFFDMYVSWCACIICVSMVNFWLVYILILNRDVIRVSRKFSSKISTPPSFLHLLVMSHPQTHITVLIILHIIYLEHSSICFSKSDSYSPSSQAFLKSTELKHITKKCHVLKVLFIFEQHGRCSLVFLSWFYLSLEQNELCEWRHHFVPNC